MFEVFHLVLKEIKTSPFNTLNFVLPASEIFPKNKCNSGPLCLADINFAYTLVVYCIGTFSKRPVYQQRKPLAVSRCLSQWLQIGYKWRKFKVSSSQRS